MILLINVKLPWFDNLSTSEKSSTNSLVSQPFDLWIATLEYKFGVVPALNQDGQEKIRHYKKDNPPGIDASLVVQTQNDKKNHLVLTDNTPYNYKIYKRVLCGTTFKKGSCCN